LQFRRRGVVLLCTFILVLVASLMFRAMLVPPGPGPLDVPLAEFGLVYDQEDVRPGTLIAVGQIPLSFTSPVRSFTIDGVGAQVESGIRIERVAVLDLNGVGFGNFSLVVETPEGNATDNSRQIAGAAEFPLQRELLVRNHPISVIVLFLRVTGDDAILRSIVVDYHADGVQYSTSVPLELSIKEFD